jgi:hypothetical protein
MIGEYDRKECFFIQSILFNNATSGYNLSQVSGKAKSNGQTFRIFPIIIYPKQDCIEH